MSKPWFYWSNQLELVLRSVCFEKKSYVKIVFHVLLYLIVLKKNSQWKTIFSQHKKYDLFLEIV